MLVCSCFAVSDRTLRSVIDAGARDAEEIGERCDAGTGCGGCLEEISEILLCHGRGGSVVGSRLQSRR
ncbi:MAG: (2Fe-2S)-binding protein [Frankia sp.]|nr:(2Fe-2S)-binding protein [Frankia sp.]